MTIADALKVVDKKKTVKVGILFFFFSGDLLNKNKKYKERSKKNKHKS